MRPISKQKVSGKKILIRIDLNCPVENGKIAGSARIAAHAQTIKNLVDHGAQVIVLAHQGRKDHNDFISLDQHAKLLHKSLGKDVIFVDDIIGHKAKKAIQNLKNGDVLVLDNVRFLDDEMTSDDSKLVTELTPLADYFVLDALSVAHRKQASIVGFTKTLPSFAGDVLYGELEAIEKIKHAKDVTFIFGGSKVDDSFSIIKKWLNEGRAREVIVGGALSILFLHASGKNVGDSKDYLTNSGLLKHAPEAKEILDKYDGKIVLPKDVGLYLNETRIESDFDKIKKGQIWDIGSKTIEEAKRIIKNSHCIVMNGPMGVYEIESFSLGTKSILETIASSDAFSLLGGGHTITAVEKLGLNKAHFGYLSLAGKALIEYLCGKDLPGISALKENEKKFSLKSEGN